MKELGALSAARCLWEVAWRGLLLTGALAAALTWPLYAGVPAALLIGVLQYHFLILSHEAQHGLIARSKRLNDLIGAWCFSYPFGQPFQSERARHLSHHRNVGTPEDPDYSRYVLEGKRPWLQTLGYFIRLALYGKVLDYAGSALSRKTGNRRSPLEFLKVAVAQGAIVAGFVVLSGDWKPGLLRYGLFWLAPLWLIAATLSEFREFCEHVSAPGSPLHLKTFRAPAWQRGLLGPVGFSYHAEHHWYPFIPHYRLRRAAERTPRDGAEAELHDSYLEVLRRIRNSARQAS